ncbi:hypothetical protein A2J03_09835 [Rhodococcus sp. EPR-157]|uniref:hypothetical protein n=1 Tax=Rhodococcus sp. EPR-157 TaxID=1813677 RepID=UPI0007BC35D2|nr:hypothetical protein [Rhodococcus sp. EPR-157]KZF00876.1 hypothetical protein A2J03_09835 [Rhodococcus sp. EPR-157]
MGSLSDGSDVGAKPIGDQRFYGGRRVGEGRWAILDTLGLLWTDDVDGLQLSSTEATTDRDAATDLRYTLIEQCRRGIGATEAFDTAIAEHGNPPVTTGDLGELI